MKTVYFLAGLAMTGNEMRNVARHFPKDQYNCIFEDNPWVGKGSRDASLNTLKDFANYHWNMIERRKVQGPVCLVGLSMGGAIAAHMALLAPEKTHSLSLINTFVNSKKYPALEELEVKKWLSAKSRSDFETLAVRLFGKKTLSSTSILHHFVEFRMNRGNEQRSFEFKKQLDAVCGFDGVCVYSQLKTKNISCFIIRGEDDRLIDESRTRELALLLGQELEQINYIAGAGHMIHLEEPEKLAALIQIILQGGPRV